MIFSRKSLLIFSLSVHNRKNLLKFLINFITDRRRSVEYSVRFFIFFFEFKIYSFMLVPTFLKKTIMHLSQVISISPTTRKKGILRQVLVDLRNIKSRNSTRTWLRCTRNWLRLSESSVYNPTS